MFSTIKSLVTARFNALVSGGTQLVVDYDRDEIWDKYLSGFAPELQQEHNCSACKSFIRQVGGIIILHPNLSYGTLWDLELDKCDEEFHASIKNLQDYIRSRPIVGLFHHNLPSAGVDKNADPKRDVIWTHFHAKIPKALVDRNGSMVQKSAEVRDSMNVFKRALDELTEESMVVVLELIGQNSLYRGNEYKHLVESLLEQHRTYHSNVTDRKEEYCWRQAVKLGPEKARVRNTAIGTLLVDLSEGMELEKAVKRFEAMVAPANYKRPTALVTPRMVEKAKERLEELGLMSALDRRRLDDRDLTAADALFVYRPTTKKGKDVFAELAGDVPASPKTLKKVEEISSADFVAKVLPGAKAVRVLFEPLHTGNLVCLTGPQDPEANNLMKWDNSFGWSYSGGVADSLREQVQKLGGRVDGVLRFSHTWNFDPEKPNQSLMDLHVFFPPYKHKARAKGDKEIHNNYPSTRRVGWNHRTDAKSGGNQDVDFVNAPGKKVPVENITFPSMDTLPDGTYTFKIHNWNARSPNRSGFRAEIEFGGQVYHYSHPQPVNHHEWITLAEAEKQNGQFTIKHLAPMAEEDVTKWGIKTGRFHTVRAITTSPNHWTKPTGNKHLFFLLEGCMADEKVRPFYNEFLRKDLAEDRKTTEALGGKIEVAPAEGVELSGLGFSETVRNHLYVEVEGAFKRTLKVLF